MSECYLKCAHCDCDFLSSRRQTKRARSTKGAGHRFYCSLICQHAGASAIRRKPVPLRGPCPSCGKEFRSRTKKVYCGMKCWTTSDKFQEMARQNAKKATAARVLQVTGEPLRPNFEFNCKECAKPHSVKPSQEGRQFCNHTCYRLYFARRFDRWIADPQGLALPQAYDEFLTKHELPCLIEGCDWVGQNLSFHANMMHGITARQLKRAAGFNLGSGLVTPELSAKLRAHAIGDNLIDAARAVPASRGAINNYRSNEGREHAMKSALMRSALPSTLPERKCMGCGCMFQPSAMGYSAKFCSIPCRAKTYAELIRDKRHKMTCSQCRKDFLGNANQARRDSLNLIVVCSLHCRQLLNAKQPRRRQAVGLTSR